MRKLLEQLAVTAELMDKQITPTALSVMVEDLKDYDQEIVIQALQNLRKESGKFSLDGIIKQIEKQNPDGRPGADEAWGMIPKDENGSCVMTEEMATAMGVAQPLLDRGDETAARMAFRESYTKLVEQNRRNGILPAWFPSLGDDERGHAAVLAEAVRLGRTTPDHAIKLLAPEQTYPMLEMAGEKDLAEKYKPLPEEEAKEYFSRWKDMLEEKKVKI